MYQYVCVSMYVYLSQINYDKQIPSSVKQELFTYLFMKILCTVFVSPSTISNINIHLNSIKCNAYSEMVTLVA